MADNRGRQRMDDEPAFGRGADVEESGGVLDLRWRSRRQRPLIEAVGCLQRRCAVGVQHGGGVVDRIQGHADKRQTVAQPVVIRPPPHVLQVRDHQRTESGQRAAGIDKGDDHDTAGEVAQRHAPTDLIDQG